MEQTVIRFRNVGRPATLRIFDITGAVVKEYRLDNDQEMVVWDAADLPAGVYLILSDANEKPLTTKTIKLK